jgi:antitoxin FitA
MASITIPLTDEQLKKLEELARQANLSPEEMARAGLTDFLRHPKQDFRDASRHVISKNTELYRRLA